MLYLVRHEETPLNAENRFRGSANPGLSERGKHAAVGLRYRLDGKFNRIICDEYARTCQTARRIAGNIPVETDNGLEPWDIGDISGTEKTPTRKREFDRRYVEHPDAVPAGGQSLNAFLRRWKPVYEKYLRESRTDNILLVIHGSNMGAVLSKFKPAPLQGSITQKPGTVLQVGGDGVPQFLESKLKSAAAKKGFTGKRAAKYVYGAMNNMGTMSGNKETAAGRAAQKKHTMKLSQLARVR